MHPATSWTGVMGFTWSDGPDRRGVDESLNATNLMVRKSGVGVRFTCSDVAGRYGGNAIHRLEICLNNKLQYILQFS